MRRATATVAIAYVMAATPAYAVPVTVVNVDPPGVGFNEATAAVPIGGNPGRTLGEQRMNAFVHAATIWSQALDGDVPVVVEASFAPLFCSETSATLGSAGPAMITANFPNAPQQWTWYPSALANQLSGTDGFPSQPDIVAYFNSGLDAPDCLGSFGWYYGLDGHHGNDFDLVTVLLHEMGHGLGFSSFVSLQTGQNAGTPPNNLPDAYSSHIYDTTQMLTWPQMSAAQRLASSVNTGGLIWSGLAMGPAASTWSDGTDSSGRPLLFSPNPVQIGSSVSHFDTSVTPNVLMEPYLNGDLGHDVDVTDRLLNDLGWRIPANGAGGQGGAGQGGAGVGAGGSGSGAGPAGGAGAGGMSNGGSGVGGMANGGGSTGGSSVGGASAGGFGGQPMGGSGVGGAGTGASDPRGGQAQGGGPSQGGAQAGGAPDGGAPVGGANAGGENAGGVYESPPDPTDPPDDPRFPICSVEGVGLKGSAGPGSMGLLGLVAAAGLAFRRRRKPR